MNNFGKAVIVLAIVGVVGFAATSFADWGRGGGGNCWGPGAGWAQRGGAPYGNQGNLSDEDLDRLNKERQAFFEDTRELRQQLYQKDLELRSEMAKKDPDANKAGAIQKEISDLEGQLAQKKISHRIKMQKENPDFFAGGGYGRGYGHGPRGRGMGRGFSGRGGGCWY
jgi:zinc resistance-associated protein